MPAPLASALLAVALCAAAPADATDYVFAGNDLADLAKQFDSHADAADPTLAKWLRPGQRVTAILMRVRKENDKVTAIDVWYATNKHPKVERVREKPFTPADAKDFAWLKGVLSLSD